MTTNVIVRKEQIYPKQARYPGANDIYLQLYEEDIYLKRCIDPPVRMSIIIPIYGSVRIRNMVPLMFDVYLSIHKRRWFPIKESRIKDIL